MEIRTENLRQNNKSILLKDDINGIRYISSRWSCLSVSRFKTDWDIPNLKPGTSLDISNLIYIGQDYESLNY